MANTKGSDNPFPSILVVEATEPTAPSAGQQRLYIDSTTHKLKRTDSSGTDVDIEAASGLSDPMTTRGDIIVRNASNVTARLARGSASQVLTSDGTDVAWAAPTAGTTPALVRLAETVLGSAAAAITFTGISGAYRDLIVSAVLRSAKAATADDFRIRVGSGSIDTGSNYSYQFTTAVNTTVTAAVGTTQTTAYFGNGLASTGLANSWSFHEMTIRDYASTSKFRAMLGQSINMQNSTSNNLMQLSALWRNAANAIDQVSVFADGGNLLTGSIVTLYGRG
jgi:hypothetical protein